MFRETAIEVKRDVAAKLVPSGADVTIKKGTQVWVTQALGDSYTLYVNGNMVRVPGKEGDALGLVALDVSDIDQIEGTVEEKMWRQLQTCFDPEIPVNIVELGLVYQAEVIPLGKDGHHISIVMTLTAPGCGMGPVIVAEVEEKIRKIREVKDVKIELVFDPPWDRDRMSDEAKLQLGLL